MTNFSLIFDSFFKKLKNNHKLSGDSLEVTKLLNHRLLHELQNNISQFSKVKISISSYIGKNFY